MASNCPMCNKKLGFWSNKNLIVDNVGLVCSACYETSQISQQKQQEPTGVEESLEASASDKEDWSYAFVYGRNSGISVAECQRLLTEGTIPTSIHSFFCGEEGIDNFLDNLLTGFRDVLSLSRFDSDKILMLNGAERCLNKGIIVDMETYHVRRGQLPHGRDYAVLLLKEKV